MHATAIWPALLDLIRAARDLIAGGHIPVEDLPRFVGLQQTGSAAAASSTVIQTAVPRLCPTMLDGISPGR